MAGSSWTMGSMWRDLPPEVLEKVLTFLPLATLCRYRTVCKKWNRLIGHPHFASSYALVSSPEEYVLITVRHGSVLDPMGWDVLDFANKKFFTLNHDFLTNYVKEIGQQKRKKSHVRRSRFERRETLAADGGLFCVAYSSGLNSVLFVCNPVLKSFKQLPYQEMGWNSPQAAGFLMLEVSKVVMSTDKASMDYDVFVFDLEGKLHIYESKTAQWREPLDVPRGIMMSSTFVFIQKELYVLFRRTDHLQGILSFNKVTGVWYDYGVELPWSGEDRSGLDLEGTHLIVSGEHLIYVSYHDRRLEVFEVILPRKECVRITRMPDELMGWVLNDFANLNHSAYGDIIVIGCANGILICSCTGASMVYRLATKSWHVYPDSNIRKHPDNNCHARYLELYGSNYCLSLCAP